MLFEIIKLIKKHQHIEHLQNNFDHALKMFPANIQNYLNEPEPFSILSQEDLNYLKCLERNQGFLEWWSESGILKYAGNITASMNNIKDTDNPATSSAVPLEKHTNIAESENALPIVPVEGSIIDPILDAVQEAITNFYY